MDKIKDILTPGKHHDTTIHSEVKPEATHESIRPAETQEINQNITREHEVHHHQHRIQPVEEKRTLDTEHKHEQLATEHRHHEQRMTDEDASRHQKMHAGIQDQQRVLPTQRTTVEGGTNTQHLTHHHIHESIQPVIQRETVQPSVVHTTKNVHEHITDRPIVHDQTVEPTLSINQFKDKVGHLTGGHSTSHHEHMKPNVVPHEGSSTGAGTSGVSGSGRQGASDTGLTGSNRGVGSGTTGINEYSSGSNRGVGGTAGTNTSNEFSGSNRGVGQTARQDVDSGLSTGATSHSGSGLTGNGAQEARSVAREVQGKHTGTGYSGNTSSTSGLRGDNVRN